MHEEPPRARLHPALPGPGGQDLCELVKGTVMVSLGAECY